jgi:hypothetical protein
MQRMHGRLTIGGRQHKPTTADTGLLGRLPGPGEDGNLDAGKRTLHRWLPAWDLGKRFLTPFFSRGVKRKGATPSISPPQRLSLHPCRLTVIFGNDSGYLYRPDPPPETAVFEPLRHSRPGRGGSCSLASSSFDVPALGAKMDCAPARGAQARNPMGPSRANKGLATTLGNRIDCAPRASHFDGARPFPFVQGCCNGCRGRLGTGAA